MVRLDPPSQHNRLTRGQPPVDLNAQVHIPPYSLPVGGHRLNGIFDLVHMGLEIVDIPAVIQKRGQVADGREAPFAGIHAAGN